MKIIEVRDGFIKLETNKKIALSSFLLIEDAEKSYIAQVIQVKRSTENSIIYSKILFNYDGTLMNYDKTLPSKTSTIQEYSFSELKKYFDSIEPFNVGNFIDNDEEILVNKKSLDNKLLASIDSSEILNLVLSNFAKQFPKTLIIDMLGNVSSEKFVAGKDFKLPLNTDSLNFMFEDCLNDATSDSKNLIKEIFTDLSEYSKTVPFLPFETLKTIIDDMVDREHVFKLLILKNKLAKFASMGYFASTTKEAENLKKILTMQNPVIDLSKLDSTFQNRYLSIIYSTLETLEDTQVFVNVSNAINKSNLKNLLTNEKIQTAFFTHSKFKYLNEMKNFYKNYIIESSFTNNKIFSAYSTFLNSINNNNYLLVGEYTNYLPLISNLRLLKEIPAKTTVSDENTAEVIETIENKNTETITEELVDASANEMTDTEIQELEDALNNSDNLDNTDNPINAIEKKSEDLIEKVSEEMSNVQTSQPESIFSSEEDIEEEHDVAQDDNELEVVIENSNEEQEFVIETQSLDNEDSTIIDSLEEKNLQQEVESYEENEEIQPEIIEELPETINDEIIEEIAIDEDISANEEINEVIVTEEEITELVNTDDMIAENDVIEEYHTQVDEIQTIEISDEISDMTEEAELEMLESSDEIEILETMEATSTDTAIEDTSSENTYQELNENNDIESVNNSEVEIIDNIDEITELDDSEITDDMIIVDLEDEDELLDAVDIEKEIIEDVDKVFTTAKNDTIIDSDLDFIDELNNDFENNNESFVLSEGMEELTELSNDTEDEDEILQPIEEINFEEPEEKEVLETKNTSTPIVPVYDADIPQEDIVSSDPIEQGDTVVHAKYGNGVVEKMIKYGNKSLYSINFDNVGRRLLDPTLTEIKKA